MQMYLYKYIVDYLQQIRLLCKTLLQWLNHTNCNGRP